jgi:opacity protein-like surface antigen
MRKAALLSLLAIAVVAAAASSQASTTAADDGCLVVDAGRGVVTVNAKGFVFGRFDQGQVDIDDPLTGDGQVRVFGYQKKRLLTDTKTRYIGFGVRFRASGLFRIRIEAIGIDMSLSGKGAGTVSSDGFIDAGTYSIDAASFCEDHFQPLPDAPHKVVVAAQSTG